MWFPLALIAGFALAFLALYLAERRSIERERAEREEGTWRAAIEPPRGPAEVTPEVGVPDEGGLPQPAPLRTRRVSIGPGDAAGEGMVATHPS